MNDTSCQTKIDKLASLMVHAEVRLDAGLRHNPDDVYLGTTYWIVKDAQKIIKELYDSYDTSHTRVKENESSR